ncbi:ribonuclease HI [Helicobacter ibis]|uniref:ribonuclease H n=1 Tax=Helicobacter ibis TaxID=2962633 RepID=A0ABT4VDK6_9HELI|nr:ribonuclease HI [Helicobacter ibis]MDA3968781.1 ribonuclease HI [Helicobacter ibis]
MKCVTLFCDGSSLGNPGAGGWCGILDYNGKRKIISGGESHTTNNRMELTALIQSLKALKEPCNVLIVSDSKYVLDGISKWLPNWIEKNFSKIKNPDLWKEYIEVSKMHKIDVMWVKGHNGHKENEMCDNIAKEEALKYKLGEHNESNAVSKSN